MNDAAEDACRDRVTVVNVRTSCTRRPDPDGLGTRMPHQLGLADIQRGDPFHGPRIIGRLFQHRALLSRRRITRRPPAGVTGTKRS